MDAISAVKFWQRGISSSTVVITCRASSSFRQFRARQSITSSQPAFVFGASAGAASSLAACRSAHPDIITG
jgi:hypothetical protein